MILDFKTIRYNKSYNKIYIELRLNFLYFGWFENSAALFPPSCHRKCFSFCLTLRLYLSTYITFFTYFFHTKTHTKTAPARKFKTKDFLPGFFVALKKF